MSRPPARRSPRLVLLLSLALLAFPLLPAEALLFDGEPASDAPDLSIVPKFWVEPDGPYVPPPVTAPRDSRAVNGYAVLFGINAYPSSPLSGCISDITAIRDKLVNSYGWDNANIHFITDSAATPQRIVQEIQWLASVAQPDSQTIFSFSGHGSPGEIIAYPMNGVSDDTVAAELGKLNSTENICIFDSCFSGACTAVNISDPEFISMMACGPGETASDGSTFSKAWVEGLGTTEWGQVEDAFQYAYNKIQGWQHPVMWDNVPEKMMLGRKPPVISPLPEGLSALEDTPLTVKLTDHEWDPVDGHDLLTWSVSWWNATSVKSVSGQNGPDDTLTFHPVPNWFGETTVTLVLTNGARRTARANLTLTWTPVNDLPRVIRLDKTWSSVERLKSVKVIVYGSDPDDLPAGLDLSVEYRAGGSSWTSAEAEHAHVTNRWELPFVPPASSPLGWADFRARLGDLEGWGEWTETGGFLEIENAEPVVSSLAASAPKVHRTQTVMISVLGADPESPRERVLCELELKHQTSDRWVRLPDVRLEGDRWSANHTPAAGALLGWYDARSRLRDADGTYGQWEEAFLLFSVENALPAVSSLVLGAREACRGEPVSVTVKGSDIEDPPEKLTCEVQYQPPGGQWVRLEGVKFLDGRWEGTFVALAYAKLGSYAFRAVLRDTLGQLSEMRPAGFELEVRNSLPSISVFNLSSPSVLRSRAVEVRLKGGDYEDKPAELACQVQYRAGEGSEWAELHLSAVVPDPSNSSWTCTFSPPINAPCGSTSFRARLRDKGLDWGPWSSPEGLLEVRNNVPEADLAPLPPVVTVGTEVSFDGSLSSDVEGPVEWHWDFGDGTVAEGERVAHAFSQRGSRTVVLSVVDGDGEVSQARAELRANALPIARMMFRQGSGVENYRVVFNSSQSVDAEGPLASFRWDFDITRDTSGDGVPDNDADSAYPSPTWNYGKEGRFFARLTVTDGDGASSSTSVEVRVKKVTAEPSWLMTTLLIVLTAAFAGAGAAAAVRRRGKRSPPPPEDRAALTPGTESAPPWESAPAAPPGQGAGDLQGGAAGPPGGWYPPPGDGRGGSPPASSWQPDAPGDGTGPYRPY